MNATERKKRMISKAAFCLLGSSRRAILKDTGWVDRLYRAYQKLLRVIPELPFVVFFDGYSRRIHQLTDNNPENRRQLKDNLLEKYNTSSPSLRMFLQCILYCSILPDEEVTETIMRSAIDTVDYGYRYWTAMDISYMTFAAGSGYYAGYYNDRKQLLKKLSVPYQIPERQATKEQERKKLCVLTYQLTPNIHNSSQRVAMMFANNLQVFYDEVMVLCMDSTWRNAEEKRRYQTICRTPRSLDHKDEISSFFNTGIWLDYAEGNGFRERNQDILNKLYDYSPNVIIDMTDEYSPLSHLYSRDFCTVYFPLRVGVTSLDHSGILTQQRTVRELNQRYHCVDSARVIEWSLPEYVPPDKGEMTRSDLGLPEDAFIFITIGHCSEIERKWIDQIRQMMLSDSSFIWILVGGAGPEYLHHACKDLMNQRRIIEWGYADDLAGFCAACDAVLRQDVSGGSGGTAIAAMKGLPIVMTNKLCDPTRWLGRDYSDITDETGITRELLRLKNDKEYYSRRSAQVKELVARETDHKERWEELNNKLTEFSKDWKRD